ncbi:hypothetical protein BKA62DRAFT_455910 [Auriculariales sp. MPI-PUGE-AT-0066]|nr:hypothetical protein BKA62DRAFT_455910 [Auriculariales sp. MPI-PUGE-AT-0066]
MPLADFKRLLVFCDGTNQDALVATDDGTAYDGDEPLYFTNVARLSRAVLPRAKAAHNGLDVLQLVYYASGVGTESDFRGHASSFELAIELFGTAVARKIRDAYAYLSQNYEDGDEIFLFGFSRGAYTARKVAGLIDRIGMLDAKDMGRFYQIWYSLETGKGDIPPRPAKPVPIKLVGVWDTVGAIRTSLTQPFPGETHRLNIHDGHLPQNVEVALHAVALHENRNWFQVTLWEDPATDEFGDAGIEPLAPGQILKQVWFGGEHSDVGGGWESHELADIALFWMAGECQPYLSIDEELLLAYIKHPLPTSGQRKPHWGASIPHNSYMHTPHALALLGHILPKTRLETDEIKRGSIFHPSTLYSPRPSASARSKHKEEQSKRDMSEKHFFEELERLFGLDAQKLCDLGFPTDAEGHPHLPHMDSSWDPRRRAELRGGLAEEEVVDVYKAMGKHMITLDDVRERLASFGSPSL